MKRIASLAVLLVLSVLASCQPKSAKPSFNFDFEQTVNGMPRGWGDFGEKEYKLSLDSTVVKSGKYAAMIASEGEKPGYRAWMFTIPGSYPGKEITLSGYIKTENVEGFAGLWLRIDPQLAFNNMQQQGLAGTTDWTRYEFTLPMNPEKTEQTVLGGLLVGKGKVWFDSLTVTIDGKNIAALKPLEKKKVPAQLDTTFDAGSTISLPVLDETLSENLKVLGLVWGFVKYYHPNIAKGDFNWDYELFRILPSFLAAGSKDERDEVLAKWIGKLGPFKKGDAVRPRSAEVKLEPDLEWISTSGFSDTLTALLLDVKNGKRTGEHFYIGMHRGVGNPDFGNENAYPKMQADDDGFRLLALYRYWNMIQYFFPYKHLIGEDWKDVLGEFVPKFIEADSTKTYVLTVLDLIGRIHDTHANVWGSNTVMNNFLGERSAPVEIQFLEAQAVVTGYRHADWGKATGLEVGDVIMSINDRSVDDVVTDWLKYTPASNYPTQLRDIAPKLLRTNDSLIRIEFKREGTTQMAELKTFEVRLLPMYSRFVNKDTSFKMLSDEIAYLNNGTLNADDLTAFWKTIKNAKGLIIDNRNYPQRPGANRVGEFLMPDNTPFVKFTIGSVQQPGLFIMSPTMNTGKKNRDYYKGKVVILVNEVTQSASEFHAMSYRVHPNVTVIGSTTAAADGNVSSILLPGGIRTSISGIGVYYPDGRETQRVGIVPDIEAKPTIKGIKAGRDEVLEKAIQFINSQ